jgi:glycosyltransferase involved in cell wall biosynthesis
VDSLLGQSLPQDELELIFVDDGSTDKSPARLDELAAQHPHVRVEHMPNSGWPGRPRNRGLELATGDFVYFVDNDDWLDPRALERLHEMALLDAADVVIGKVVGHGGKSSARALFRENLHGVRFEEKPLLLLKLLTPHKLFRRAFIEQHGLRFPEGRRRLEDHLFVVDAYFRAERISLLADHPCYHWVFHDAQANASHRPIEAGYFDNVREVLDLVEQHTEPGEFRDQLLLHWYRGKMLGRLTGRGLLRREPEHRRELFEVIRKLALERFGDDVHARLPLSLRVRSRLLRDGSLDGLIALAEFESGLTSKVKLRELQAPGTHLTLQLSARIEGRHHSLIFKRDGDRVLWEPPEPLRGLIAEDDCDVTRELRRSTAPAYLERLEDDLQYMLPSATKVRLDEESEPGRVIPVVESTVAIAPTIAAGGAPLPAGQWHIEAGISAAGFSGSRTVTKDGHKLVVTTQPPGRIVEGRHGPAGPSLKRRLRSRMPWLARALRQTRAIRGAAVRG